MSDNSTAQSVRNHPFSGKMVLTADGGLSIGKTDYSGTINSYTVNGSVEYFFPTTNRHIFGIRLFSGIANIKGEDDRREPYSSFSTDIKSLGLGLIYSYSINDVFFPYLLGGAAYNWFDPMKGEGGRLPNNAGNVYDNGAFSYDLEGGIRFKINKNWTIKAAGKIHFIQSDYLDDVSPQTQDVNIGEFPAGPHNDFFATAVIGVSFSFLGDNDSDGDGIENSRDLCPDTPVGILIDENGCPLDTDNDGIPDYQDKCPETPKGIGVDSDGCPVDSDSDGVPDDLDRCSGTPDGVEVNENGCPVDFDNDGIPDYRDKCPDTGIGLIVDADGCPVDTDQDGVVDSLDKCPDTPIGVKVDENGCEVVEETSETIQPERTERETTVPVRPDINIPAPTPQKKDITDIPANTDKIVISGEETFETGTARIKQSAHSNLNNIVAFLSKDPWTKWKIQGYVDSQTPEERKLPLSFERADAIMKYFVSHGSPSFQFQVYGLGDEDPVASNNTAEGRSKNRRIELVKIKK